MKTFTCKIPTWALNYLINNDVDGLTPDEIDMIHQWEISFETSFSISISGNRYFSNSPDFGLPCEVEECEILCHT
jgi:hypothetical protein